MTRPKLHLDDDGNLWLFQEGTDPEHGRRLGPPCGDHFHDVPHELWDELEVLIGDRIDAEAFALGCDAAVMGAWNRSRM